jgi:hypothetical protein
MNWLNIIEKLALILSYSLVVLGIVFSIFIIMYGVIRCINRLSWMLVDCYGGMKAFKEYRKWYIQNKNTLSGE